MNEEPETDYKPMTEIVAEGDSLVDVADLLADDPKALAEYVRALAKQLADLEKDMCDGMRHRRAERLRLEAMGKMIEIGKLEPSERIARVRKMSPVERAKYFDAIDLDATIATMESATKNERAEWLLYAKLGARDQIRLLDEKLPARVRVQCAPGFVYAPLRRTVSADTAKQIHKAGLGEWLTSDGQRHWCRSISPPATMSAADYAALVAHGDPIAGLVEQKHVTVTPLTDDENKAWQLRLWREAREQQRGRL